MKKFIFHSFPSWDAPYIKSTVEIIKQFDEGTEVNFIDYPYTWKDLFFKKHSPWKNILGINKGPRKFKSANGADIKIWNLPPFLPGGKAVLKINKQIFRFWLRRFNKREDLKSMNYVNAMSPLWGMEYINLVQPKKSVYYVYDNIDAMKWAKDQFAHAEKDFVNMIDQIITSSRSLLDKYSSYGKKIEVVNNGFDSDKIPVKTSESKNEGIYYLGAVDNRIDHELIEYLLKENASLNFKFIGKVTNPKMLKLMENYPNLHLLGAMNQEKAFKEMLNAELCVIPFKKTSFTKYIYPLKVNEYLAMAKAVVSTDFSIDIEDFQNIISIAKTHSEFQEKLMNEISDNSRELEMHRVESSKKHSWKARAQQFQAIFH